MNFFESLIYGIVSGLTEIFPVSAEANQMVMRHLFGVPQKEPVRDILVHIAVLIAVFLACKGMFTKIRREQVLAYRMRRNPSQIRALKGVYDMRLVRSAVPIMVVGLFANLLFTDFYDRRPLFALVLLINGALNLIPIYMHQGNKDARIMARADSGLIGLAAACSAVPGISRNGAIMFMTLVRKADKQNGLTWSLLLTVPALIVLLILDFISIFTVGVSAVTIGVLGGYMVSMLAAFAGAFLAVNTLKVIVLRSDYSGFAYYDFGLALLTLVLYLVA